MPQRFRVPLASVEISDNAKKYVNEALDTGWISSRGDFVRKFEDALFAYVGRPTISCTSGTAALHLALLAEGIGPGDEVIVPNLTFAACVSAVLAVGAKPILVEPDSKSWVIGSEVTEYVREKTKAIIPVHLYGVRADVDGLARRLLDHSRPDIAIIEDSCESFEPASKSAHYTVYSFFANKHITTGEGGAVTAKDVARRSRLRHYRDGGFVHSGEFEHIIPGLNYRMTNLTAALGVAQMEEREGLMAARRKNAEFYDAFCEEEGPLRTWLYAARAPGDNNAGVMTERLRASGIEARRLFQPMDWQVAFHGRTQYITNRQRIGSEKLDLIPSDRAYDNFVSVPTGPHLSDLDRKFVIEQVEEIHAEFA